MNFKSKLLEWAQKNRVKLEFRMNKQGMDKEGSPTFAYQVFLEGVAGEEGKGFSKKESQQLASKATLQRLKKEPQFIDAIFTAKSERTQMEEMPVSAAPDTTEPRKDAFLIKPQEQDNNKQPQASDDTRPANKRKARRQAKGTTPDSGQDTAEDSPKDNDFDLSDITLEGKDREDVIARAEAAAYQ